MPPEPAPRAIVGIFGEMKDWLSVHQPSLQDSLQAPSLEDSSLIREYNKLLRKRSKIQLPKELIELWSVCAGSKDSFLFATPDDSATFFDIKNSLELYRDEYTCEDEEETNEEGTVYIPDGWAQKTWFPIGWIPNGGELFLDLKPGPNGVKGQLVQNDSEGGFIALATNLTAYLQWLLNSFRSGEVTFEDNKFPTASNRLYYQTLFDPSTASPVSYDDENVSDGEDEDSEAEEDGERGNLGGFSVTLRILVVIVKVKILLLPHLKSLHLQPF